MTSIEERWQERLAEARVRVGSGLEPELLAERYDAETADEIAELTQQATKEMIRGGHTLLTLDDLDVAEQKLEEAGNYEVATDGGVDQSSSGTDQTCDHCDGEMIVDSNWSADDEERGWQRITRYRCRDCGSEDVETVARDDVEIATDGGTVEDGTERPPFVDATADYAECHFCGQTWEPTVVDGFDLSREDEYYPKMVPVCPEHAGGCR